MLKKIDSCLPSFQGDIITADANLPINDNDDVDVNQVLSATDNVEFNVDGNDVIDGNGVLGLNDNVDYHVNDSVIVDVGNVDENDSLAKSLDENEEVRGMGAISVDEMRLLGVRVIY